VRFGVDVDWTLGLGAEELVPNVARSRSHLARRQRFQMLSRFPKLEILAAEFFLEEFGEVLLTDGVLQEFLQTESPSLHSLGLDFLPRFILIPKIDGIADPRVGRLGARDERVVLDVLFVETDVRLGHFGHFDVGTGQLLAKELDLLVDGGRRALELHLGH